ncbi:MAG TPA: cytochrome c [Chloroflexota bacterium]|nr:cytochrome c [Chloroflexota bacterium]
MTYSFGSVVLSGAVAVGLTIATLVALRTTTPTAPGATLHEQGRTLFQQKGCIGCHSVTDKGLVSRTPMAPDLSALGQRAAARRPGLAADAYVKESVRQPQAYLVPGFTEIEMPTLPVSDMEVEAIAAFLLAPPPGATR